MTLLLEKKVSSRVLLPLDLTSFLVSVWFELTCTTICFATPAMAALFASSCDLSETAVYVMIRPAKTGSAVRRASSMAEVFI